MIMMPSCGDIFGTEFVKFCGTETQLTLIFARTAHWMRFTLVVSARVDRRSVRVLAADQIGESSFN